MVDDKFQSTWKERLQLTLEAVSFVIMIISYVITAHVLKLLIWPLGLKIEYVNADPFPYKPIFKDLLKVRRLCE